MKWQQKFNSSHLKEIQKQHIEVYYKIFIYVSFRAISYLNQRTVRHLGLIFTLINYVLVTSQQYKPFKATPKYLPTIKYCLKLFHCVF